MSALVLRTERPRREPAARGSRPSIREVAWLGRDEAAGWSPGQEVSWAGRAYRVVGQAEDGPARLQPVEV